MQQLMLLNLGAPHTPSLENFITGKNAELLACLHTLGNRTAPEHFVYLWGESATGKTHLLQALSAFTPAKLIRDHAAPHAFVYDPDISLYLVDNCHLLSPEQQIQAFGLFNDIRAEGGFMVTAGDAPPATLSLRDDLKSRLSWGLIYRIHALTDDEKLEALERQAQSRGMSLPSHISTWLIRHYPRDMHSLSLIVDALDRYSLETKREITLPLLLELLQKNSILST